MTYDPVTFGLAWLAYSLLAADFALRVRGRRRPILSRLTAVVVLAHVACVYVFRFDGSITVALEKSLPGFVLFHSALLAIVAAPVSPEPWRTRLVVAAFPIVSLGALGAPFRYPELAVLALPLYSVGAAAVVFACRGCRARRRPR